MRFQLSASHDQEAVVESLMFLTKLIGGLLMPVPIILGLLGLGLLLLTFRYRRIGGVVVVGGVGLFVALSSPPLPERILLSLESQYPPMLEPPAAEWIVVLGGGVKIAPELPAVSQLSSSSVQRLTEGIRVRRLVPCARLIFTGSAMHEQVSIAEVMAAAAAELGVAYRHIDVLPEPKNTASEASAVARHIQKSDTVILVTSASHMKRAESLFEAAGVSVVPAPAGYLVDPRREERNIRAQLPQSAYLQFVETAWWEYLGIFWAKLRGDV